MLVLNRAVCDIKKKSEWTIAIRTIIKTIIEQSDNRTIGRSDNRTIGQSHNRTIGQSHNRTDHTIGQIRRSDDHFSLSSLARLIRSLAHSPDGDLVIVLGYAAHGADSVVTMEINHVKATGIKLLPLLDL